MLRKEGEKKGEKRKIDREGNGQTIEFYIWRCVQHSEEKRKGSKRQDDVTHAKQTKHVDRVLFFVFFNLR